MLLKSKLLILVTFLSCGIAIAGIALSLSQDDTDNHVFNKSPILEPQLRSEQPRNTYPLSTQQISNLVDNAGKEAALEQSAEAAQAQKVPLALPSSLQGTRLPLALDVSDTGELIINKKIKRLFDYYLSAIGEESLDMIVARIQQSIRSQLVDPALSQGIDILTGYLQYLNEITAIKQEFEQNGNAGLENGVAGEYALENVIRAREMVLDARANYLDSDVIDAFFGQSDEYEDYMLSVAKINKNSSLTEAEKELAKAELDVTAPAWLLEQQHNANQLNDYREQYNALQSQGVSQAELQDLTQASFSPEVADRLAKLNESRQQWQTKLDEYRAELAVITAGGNSNSEQQQLEIAQLREAYFSPQEIKRVNALDGIKLTKTVQ